MKIGPVIILLADMKFEKRSKWKGPYLKLQKKVNATGHLHRNPTRKPRAPEPGQEATE